MSKVKTQAFIKRLSPESKQKLVGILRERMAAKEQPLAPIPTVSLAYHAKAVEALRKQLLKSEQDRLSHAQALRSYQTQFEGLSSKTEGELKRLAEIQYLKAEKNHSDETDWFIDSEEIVQKVLARMPKPKEGLPGLPGRDAPAADVNKDALIAEVIRELQKGDKLHIKDIRGAAGFIKDGVRYRYEELMHGGGSAGVAVVTITGTVDDSNMTFTATTQPTLLNINGAFYKTTGGAITWTYSGGTITLSSPVGTGGQIYGIR